jgi:hypothetical protein
MAQCGLIPTVTVEAEEDRRPRMKGSRDRETL